MFTRIVKSRLAFHIYWWILLYVFFIHLISFREDESLRWNIYLYFFFLTLPVDLHFFALHFFFKRKKYLHYTFFLLILIATVGVLTNLYNIHFLNSPDTIPKNIIEVTLVIIIATAIKIVKDGFKQKIQLQEIQEQQLKTELQLLKSQVNPHFLFNTLNNLYSLSLDNSEKLPHSIKKLSDLMAYMFECFKLQSIELKKEIDFIKNYLELEKLRLPVGSNITFDVKGDVNKKNIAPMLFIPIVENCFKHGAKATTGYIFIHITMTIQPFRLIFNAENNIGLKPGSSTSAMGLKNLKRRLELIYPDSHNLSVKKTKASFGVSMEIQWRK
jgi:two-component system LytT family sensor kinase